MTTFPELKLKINTLQDFYQKELGKKESLLERKEMVEKELQVLAHSIEVDEQVKILLDLFVKGTEKDIKKDIEPIVNEAFKFVFNQALFFHLVFITRRNQIEVDFIIIRDSKVEEKFLSWFDDILKHANEIETLIESTRNINYMYGGSVNQVLSLVLLFTLSELLKISGPLVLDEPTSMVDETYNNKLGQLISSLSRQFNRQYIFLTHSTSLASYADRIYTVKKVNHISHVIEGVE